MAKRVYFCFHYQDVGDFRANVVRNHWLTKSDREDAGFFDASLWEEARKRGDTAIKRLINSGLDGTSATCILIGSQTYARRWVYNNFASWVG
jgi:antiphage defense system Thoeris ThsB-like protein